MTLAKKFKNLRATRGLSLADVGARADLERSTIWKIENGLRPRGSTLQRAALRGLGLGKNSADWSELRALWTSEGTGQSVSAQALDAEISDARLRANGELSAFIRAASRLSPEALADLQKAVQRPAVLRGLAALNEIYESTQPTRARRT